MSKVASLKTTIEASTIFEDLLKRLVARDPALANKLMFLDMNDLITDCVNRAAANLRNKGLDIDVVVRDWKGDAQKYVDGKKVHIVIKSGDFKRGVAVLIDKEKGVIQFAADEYGNQGNETYKHEVFKLVEEFNESFRNEALKKGLEILGYVIEEIKEFDSEDPDTKLPRRIFYIRGARQGKTIQIAASGGAVNIDFEGFEGNECQNEEDAFRIILGKMGVKSDVTYSDNSKEREQERKKERKKESA